MQRPGKRRSTISACKSPRSSLFTSLSTFDWYEEDAWTEIAKFLDGRSLAMLGLVNKWFHRLMTEDCLWKYATLRDLQVPTPPGEASYKWRHIYSSAFDGTHSYSFHQQEKHIDWMRIGAFFFDSPCALLTEHLSLPNILLRIDEDPGKTIQASGTCMLDNVKTGIWIADLQLVRCPVCNLNTCEGTMQTLDARHVELFLYEEFKSGEWDYEELGVHRVQEHACAASGALLDAKYIKSERIAGVLDVKSWVGQPSDWQPKAKICLHAVAVNTNLQPNEGVNVKFQVMRAGEDGEIISIRVSQQLL